MLKNTGLILGLGLAVAIAVPLSSAMAQLAPPLSPAEQKRLEDAKKQVKPNNAQPPVVQPPRGGPPGGTPGQSGRPPRVDGEQPRRNPDVQRQPIPQRTIQTPPPVTNTQPPVQQPPRKEFLPKSNNVPQLKQRPELGTVPGTPPGTLPPGTPPKTPTIQRNVPVLPPATQRTGVPPVPNTSVPIQTPPVKSQVITPPVKSQVITPPVVNQSVGTTPPPIVGQSGGRPPQTGAGGVPSAVLPTAPRTGGAAGGFRPGFQSGGAPVQALSDVQKGRTQRTEAGGRRTVIQETDNRIIIKQDNRTIIRHDETQRFARNATAVRSQRRPDGTTQTVIVRPGGVQLINVVDNSGRMVRRYRRDERGREVNIIDNRSFYRNLGIGVGVGLAIGAVALALRPPEVRIAREKYIVDYDRASDDDIYEAFTAAPVERLERRYSLEEVRFSPELRDRVRRVDLDTITFETGSWDVGQDQFPKLERVARVIKRVIEQRPTEVFLVEGHTDAVGADVDNLTLSDRRAQAVAEILSSSFDIPPENLVTQGYGEQYLKVPSQDSERINRRVAIRNITQLMGQEQR